MNRDYQEMLKENLKGAYKRFGDAMHEQFKDVPGVRALKDDEFVQWFDAMMAQSEVVTVVAEGPPATDWVTEGTVMTGPAWLLMMSMPSTRDGARELGRYSRLTGQINPMKVARAGGR